MRFARLEMIQMAGRVPAWSIGASPMSLRRGKQPPRCRSGVAITASVPTRCCCVPGRYSIGEAPMLLASLGWGRGRASDRVPSAQGPGAGANRAARRTRHRVGRAAR
jgi:hypothetical protein